MNLKKLTLAAGLAAASTAPAMAQSTVQIYGKLYPYVLNEHTSGPTAPGTPVSTLSGTPTLVDGTASVTGLQAANSRLGFRGTEDLGGGMRANFQLEGVAAVDTGGPFMFNRNTYVELAGGFGSIKLGNHDTIFKEYGDTLGILGLSSGSFMSSSDVLRKTGFGTSSASSFHLRRANSVIYTTPEVQHVQFGVQTSTDEVATGPHKPRLWSFGAHYDNGPLYVAIAHELHIDFYGGSANAPAAMRNNAATDPTHSQDRATEIVVEYRLNKQHRFEVDLVQKSYKEDATVAGRFQSYKNRSWLIGTENRWTEQWRTAANIVHATAGSCTRIATVCVTDGLTGTKYTAAVGYDMSKRTMLFGAASTIKNGKSARYSNVELLGSPNPGGDIRQVALGISHNF
jgi:predicted porin